MDEIRARIEGLVQPIAAAHGCELVAARVRRGKRVAVVTVFLDVERADPTEHEISAAERPFDPAAEPIPAPYTGSRISVETCARVSAELGAVIDAENVIPGRYVLEVSSPGLERPLVGRKDFVRFRGHPVDVRIRGDGGGTRRFRGTLAAVAADGITVMPFAGEPIEPPADGRGVWAPFAGVISARLVYRDPAGPRSKKGARGARGKS